VQFCAENVVQMFLFRTVIIAGPGDGKPKTVAIKSQAFLRVAYAYGCVIDAKEKFAGLRQVAPFLQSLAIGELQYFKDVVVEILEVECLDTGGGGDICR